MSASHPPRTADVVATITSKSSDRFEAVISCEVTLDAADPLIATIRRGGVTSSEAVVQLLGGEREANTGPGRPTLESKPGKSATVHVGYSVYGIVVGRSTGWISARFELEDANLIERSDESIVSSRKLTVKTEGDAQITAIIGGDAVEQSATAAVFEGKPAPLSIVVEFGIARESDSKAATGLKEKLDESIILQYLTNRSPFAALAVAPDTHLLLEGCLLVGPWFILLLLCRNRRSTDTSTRYAWMIGSLVSYCGAAAVCASVFLDDEDLAIAAFALGPVAVAAAIRTIRQQFWCNRSLVIRLAAVGAVCIVSRILGSGVASLLFVGPATLVIMLLAGAVAVARRGTLLTGAAIGLAVAGILAVSDSMIHYKVVGVGVGVGVGVEGADCLAFLFVAVPMGLYVGLIADVALIEPRPIQYTTARRSGLFVTCLALFVPPCLPLFLESPVAGPAHGRFGGLDVAVTLLDVILVGITIGLLSRRGRQPAALGDPLGWALALVCLLVVVPEKGLSVQFSVFAVILLASFWQLMLPRSRSGAAVALAGIREGTHIALFRAELRRRLMELAAHDTYRQARAKLVDGTTPIRQYDAAQRRIDDAATSTSRRISGINVKDALATTGGVTPGRSAVAAMLCATPFLAIVVGYELCALAGSPSLLHVDIEHLVLELLHHLRWVAYAAVYGYFYPIARGRGPIAKAFALIVVFLPAELLSVLANVDPFEKVGTASEITTPSALAFALVIRVGQVVAFFLFLGLAWERRLAHLAGYRWDRLRNIRSVRALATPASAVAVAVATAVGTAVAGAAVAAILSSVPGPSAPTPSPSAPASSSAPSGYP